MNVVLAKAGTHTELPRSAMHGMDSRFHGNDIDLLRLLANYAELDKAGQTPVSEAPQRLTVALA